MVLISNVTTIGKTFRWLCFYGQLVVILAFCIFAYLRIYYFLKFSAKASDLKDTHKMYNRIKYYPLCLIVGYSVATVRRFVELWDVNLGFGVAMATSVTTGLFGFFLLMVYGRLGKLNKLFKRDYPFCIPFCRMTDRICFCFQEYESDTEASRNSKTPNKSKTDAKAREGMDKETTPRPPALDAVTSAGSDCVSNPRPVAGGISLDAPLSPLAAAGRTDLCITPRPSESTKAPKLTMSDSKAHVLKEVIGHRNLLAPDQETLVDMPEAEE